MQDADQAPWRPAPPLGPGLHRATWAVAYSALLCLLQPCNLAGWGVDWCGGHVAAGVHPDHARRPVVDARQAFCLIGRALRRSPPMTLPWHDGAPRAQSTTVSLATDSSSHLLPWRAKWTWARSSVPLPSRASTLPSPNLV